MENEEECMVIGEQKESDDDTTGRFTEKSEDTLEDEDDVEDSSRISEKLYQADQQYLRSLLPEETWRKILSMMRSSPEDLRNCVNASPYFWELQRDQRVTFLFPGVFDVLVYSNEPRNWFEVSELEVKQPEVKVKDLQVPEVKTEKENAEVEPEEVDMELVKDFAEKIAEDGNDNDYTDVQDESDDDDIDGLKKDLNGEPFWRLPAGTREKDRKWIKAVQNSRLVCTTWNKAIENCYARPEMNDIEDFNDDPNPLSPFNLLDDPWTRTWLSCTRSARSFIKHFEASHHSGIKAPPKNPVFGRYMSFDIDTSMGSKYGNGRNQKKLPQTKILEMFGKELWYTRIYLSSWRLPYEQLYLLIREWLCLMPNLKYLLLCEFDCTGKVSQSLLTSHPMPKLENIQMIEIDEESGGPIINEVLRKNGQVFHLKLGNTQKFDKKIGQSLPNLIRYASTENMDSQCDAMMEKYGSGWKLTKADVYKRNGDFSGLFKLLENNWGDTLTDLRLDFPYDCKTNILGSSKDLRLNLPLLRRLRLSVGGFVLLDFILPLGDTLEYLEVSTWDPFEDRDGFRKARSAVAHEQVIQFAGFEKRMHQSNIWKILKKLKTIRVQLLGDCGGGSRFAVYTRNGDKLEFIRKNVCCSDKFDMYYR